MTSSGLSGAWTFDKSSGVSKSARLEELRGVVHRSQRHPRGLKLLLVAREPVCEHGSQAAEQRAGRRLRRVIVAAKLSGDGTVDDTV